VKRFTRRTVVKGSFAAGRVRRWSLVVLGISALTFILFVAGTGSTARAAGASEAQRLTLLRLATRVTNNELRYLHTTWWDENYHYEVLRGLEAALPGAPLSDGRSVRPQAEALCATAMMLANGRYDGAVVGISRDEALRRVVAWSNALAVSYDEQAWGRSWQSALWTYYWAYGSRQVWRSLPKTTQIEISAAVATEADRLLGIPPPFYADAAGVIRYPGDSKSEENAWNASLLYFAAKSYPSSANAAAWMAQARWYMLSAYATPDQVGSDPRITGSNLNSDGTVTNHGYLNVDYMTCQAEFAMKAQILARQTKSRVPWEFSNNSARIWRALTRLLFDGSTIYLRDAQGRPSANVYYPEGYAYSESRRFNLAQLDVETFFQRNDKQAYAWAKAHLQATLDQQARHEDGRTFAPGENIDTADESFLAITAAEMVSRLLYR